MNLKNQRSAHIGVDALNYVEGVQGREGFKEKEKISERSYGEGLYYSKVLFISVLVVTIVACAGIVSYLRMPDSTYYTSDYKGDIRVLVPYSPASGQ